jgi:diguanylate cyclase (GGDEF)-like protein/PAS domain S-box-containing protein
MKKPLPKKKKTRARPAAKPKARKAKTSKSRAGAERRSAPKRRANDRLPDFRDLVENSVQGILVHRNFKPLYANDAFAKLFGYRNAAAVLGLPLLKPLIPDDMWAQVEEEYGDLVRGRRKAVIARSRAIKKDGSEFWMAVTKRAIMWHGEHALQVNAFDISEQMEVEQVLLESEQRLRSMLEILPYPIYIARHDDGQLLFVNRKTCLLLQRNASQLLRSRSIDFFVNPKEREDLSAMLKKVGDIRDVEIRMKTAQGIEFTAEVAVITMEYGGDAALLVALNDVSERKKLEAQLFHEANTDMLTGISNRRYFLAQAEQELRRARRFARDMAVLMVDLDHFKGVNDTYGHAAGDAVLQGFVKRSLESLRQSDVMGRIGGEEFAVILPETDLPAAIEAANRLRKHISDRPMVASGSDATYAAIECTVSIGVAELDADDKDIDALFKRADECLYRAKKAGRNRVESAG